jgi:DNA repair exonuclease SbcCD ATPase subunit
MKPVSLNLKNFFSHKDSELVFDFQSALLIGNTDGDYSKSNGCGKSAIFEAITWGLFGKSRAPVQNDLVKWGEDLASVEFIFEEGEDLYKVERKRNRLNGTSHVSFFKKDEIEEWIDVSGSTSSLTAKEIERVIRTDYKTFINSVYFRQNDISEFAEAEPFKKKEILKNVIDISRWDDYEKDAKDRGREIKVQIQLLKNSLLDTEDLENERAKREVLLEENNEKLEILNNNYSALDKRYTHSFEEYVNMKNSLDTNQYDKIVLEINDSKGKIKTLASDISTVSESLKKNSESIVKLKNKKSSLEEDMVGLKVDSSISIDISSVKERLMEVTSDLKVEETLLIRLKEQEVCEGSCSLCNQEIDDSLHSKLKEAHDKRIADRSSTVSSLTKEKDNLAISLRDLESQKRLSDKCKDLKEKVSFLDEKLNFYLDQESNFKDKLEELNTRDKEEQSILTGLEISLNSLKSPDFKKLKDDIAIMKEEKKVLSEKIMKVTKNVALIENSLEEINEKINHNKSQKVDIKKLQEELVVYNNLAKFLGKSGIQVILINSLIEDLEVVANNILKDICNEPIKVSLETQRERSDGASVVETLDLSIIKDGFKYNFKSLSGGEKFRIALALRIGLAELSSRYGGGSLEFIMMDEVNSPLDRYGVETLFVSVINKLSKKYKILNITHDESLKEKFTNVIDVTKVNGESSVNFYSFN